jgi:hypothetical protein
MEFRTETNQMLTVAVSIAEVAEKGKVVFPLKIALRVCVRSTSFALPIKRTPCILKEGQVANAS